MTYAFLVDGVIRAETATLPTAGRLDTDEDGWIIDLEDAPVEVQQAAGWYLVVMSPRPPDTATTRQQRSLILVAGIPTEQWTEQTKTQDEIDADVETGNAATLTADAVQNIEALLASVVVLNGITAMTNATINGNPAAVIKDLVRECKTIARQTVRIARLVTGSTLSADVGT